MEFVQEAVEDGGENQTDAGQKGHTTKQRVAAGEDFSAGSLEFAHGPHARENHGGIGKGIDPLHPFQKMVSDHADDQREKHHTNSKRGAAREPVIEFALGQDRLGAMFECKWGE